MERNKVVIMLGGNLGDTGAVLMKSIQLLRNSVGTIVKTSSVYTTEPWGEPDQQNFLNQAIVMKTKLSAYQLLTKINEIEEILGRIRGPINGPRVIDIDIIFYNDLVINDLNLTIPHPRFHLRRFNLVPVEEIVPEFIHPVLRKNTRELLELCSDSLKVYIENQYN